MLSRFQPGMMTVDKKPVERPTNSCRRIRGHPERIALVNYILLFWRGKWWWVRLMVMMVITCSWGKRSSAGWRWGTSRWAIGKAGTRTHPRSPLVPDNKSTDGWQVFLFYPLSLGLNLWWGYSGWDGIWEIWIFLQGLRLTTPTLNPCNLRGSLK